jgi:hypothetical protein
VHLLLEFLLHESLHGPVAPSGEGFIFQFIFLDLLRFLFWVRSWGPVARSKARHAGAGFSAKSFGGGVQPPVFFSILANGSGLGLIFFVSGFSPLVFLLPVVEFLSA